MTIGISTNPIPSTGALSFSTLRNTLKETTTGSVTLSDYYRNGNIVPSASTNGNLPTSGTISLSQFRGVISRIFTTVTNVEQNLSTNSIFGNEYGYNIRKVLVVNGYIISQSPSSYALTVNDGSPSSIELNLVGGGIFGSRGVGGGQAQDGQGGGPAVLLGQSTQIYGVSQAAIRGGGGGGGGGGAGGTEGSAGRNYQPRCCGWFCPSQNCGDCNNTVGGGGDGGGAGGAGGSGRGYSWNGTTLTELAPTSGQGGGSPGNGGGAGGTGGSGATWAQTGGNGQGGQSGSTGPGGGCAGGGGGGGGQGGGSGASGGTSVVNAGTYLLGSTYGNVSVS